MQDLLRENHHTESAAVLALSGINLLVPDIMVEEIFWPETVQSVQNCPDWFLGYTSWQQSRIPVISFERLNGSAGGEFINGKSVAIINGSVNHNHLPFYAVLLEDKTRFLPLDKKSIAPDFGRQIMRAEACWTKIGSDIAVIPKVEWIEEHLLAYVLNR